MHRVLVLGAGKIGSLIAGLLAEWAAYEQLGDVSEVAAQAGWRQHGIKALRHTASMQPTRMSSTRSKNVSVDAVISSSPITATSASPNCAASKIHYFDLTEDVESLARYVVMAHGATRAFVPNVLAPGFISIAANELIQHFDELRTVKLRVGALPQHPNMCQVFAPWSTEGLINESAIHVRPS